MLLAMLQSTTKCHFDLFSSTVFDQDTVTSSLPKCPMHFGELPAADGANDLEIMDSRH
jgi:hypothetical protein